MWVGGKVGIGIRVHVCVGYWFRALFLCGYLWCLGLFVVGWVGQRWVWFFPGSLGSLCFVVCVVCSCVCLWLIVWVFHSHPICQDVV